MCASEKPVCEDEPDALTDAELFALIKQNREMIEDLFNHLADLKHGYVQLFMKDGEYLRSDRLSQHLAKQRRQKVRLHPPS